MTVHTTPDIGQLRELPLSAPGFSYAPQTWGWVLLALLLMAVITTLYLWRRLRWQRSRYRREALIQLAHIEQYLDPHFQNRPQRVAAVREIPDLMKRVALSIPGHEPVASLRGEQWQVYLQRHAPLPMPSDLARQLADLAYQPSERVAALKTEQLRELLSLCRRWIEAHHVAI